MAEKQFVIRIVNETQGGAGAKVGGPGGVANRTGGSKTQSKKGEGGGWEEALGERLKKMVAPVALYRATKSVVDQVGNHHISLVEIRTGSKEQQQRISFAYNTANGFLESGISGAMQGATIGGGWGALIGSVVGLVQQGASMGINYLMQSDVLSKQRSLEQMQQDLSAQRVTVSGSRFMNASQM